MFLRPGSPIRTWVERWVSFGVKYPWIAVSISLVLTLVALWSASGLSLKTDLAALLPRTYPSVREMDHVREKVGGLEKIVVLIESPDSAANRRFAHDVADRLARRPEVMFTEWHQDMSFFDDRRLLYMDLEDLGEVYRRVSSRVQMDAFAEPLDFSDIEAKYAATSGKGSSDGWATHDGTTRIALAYPGGASSNVGTARSLLAMARREADALNPATYNPDMRVSFGGEFRNRVDEYEVILSDITSTAFIAIAGIILFISIYFRQFFAWFFIGYPLISGLAWTFGVTDLAIGNLNLITGFLIAVLAGLGIDFGIHVFSRYIEERGHGHDLEEATRLAVVHTGSALATSATTTIAAFYSLMITDFKGFSEFGFIAGTGVLFTLLALLLTFPPLIAIGEKFHLVRHRKNMAEWRKTTAPFPYARQIVYAAAAALAILGIAAIGPARILGIDNLDAVPRALQGMRFEYDFSNLRPNLALSNEVKTKISNIRPMETAPAAIVVEDSVERQEVARILNERKDADTLSPTIKDVRTIESLIPADQERKMGLIRRLRNLFEEHGDEILADQAEIDTSQLNRWLAVEPVTAEDLPDYVTRKFRGKDGSLGEFVAIGTTVGLRNGLRAIEFANDVRTVTTNDSTYYASGSAIIFADMLIVMRRDSTIAVTITAIVVFAIVLIDFRSLRKAFIVTLPLMGAIAFMLGAMAVLGVKLNFYNMVILPSIIGMGIDNGVHFYHRYLEEGPRSIRYVVRTTGGAAFMASLTTMVGFSGMITAQHEGLNSMGDAAILGMLGVIVMSIIVLPAFLSYREDRSGHPTERSKTAERGKVPDPVTTDES